MVGSVCDAMGANSHPFTLVIYLLIPPTQPYHTYHTIQTVVTRGPAGALWKGSWWGQAVAVKMITATPPAPAPSSSSSSLSAAGGLESHRQVSSMDADMPMSHINSPD